MVTTIASTNRLYIASRNSSQRRPYGYRRVSAFHNRQCHLVYVKIVVVNYFSLYVNAACIRTIAVFYLSYMTLGSRRKIALDTQPSYRYLINIGSNIRSEEHTSELQSRFDLVCRLLLETKNKTLIVLCSYSLT